MGGLLPPTLPSVDGRPAGQPPTTRILQVASGSTARSEAPSAASNQPIHTETVGCLDAPVQSSASTAVPPPPVGPPPAADDAAIRKDAAQAASGKDKEKLSKDKKEKEKGNRH